MPKVVVNTDRYILSVPNQTPNQPPVARVLTRGEVVEVSAEEYERGKAAEVRNHYTVGTVTVPRMEPALLPAEAATDHATAAATAVAESRTEALLRELAAVSATIAPERLAELAGNVSPGAEAGVPTLAAEPDKSESPGGGDDHPAPVPAPGSGTPVVTVADPSPAPAPPAPPPAPGATKATGAAKKSPRTPER